MKESSVDFYDHPVLHPNQLRLQTPAMKKLNEEVHRWLWTGATGGLITGAARVGKTTAIRLLSSQLKTRGNETIPSYYISIPRRDQRTIMSVFRLLCMSEDLRVTVNDRADHLSDRFVHYIAENAAKVDCPYAVLFIDEMQHLYPAQFGPFAEIYDKLLIFGISLTVVFIGNDQESWHLIELIQQPRYAHIHGRFFTQGTTFLGLKSKEDVKGCLKQYDKLRYPSTGPTYTEYFLSDEYKNGWRLSSLSSDIWRVFHSYQKPYRIDSWGMQYFTATVNTLLSDFLPRYGVEDVDDDMIHECIRISGLIPSLVHKIS